MVESDVLRERIKVAIQKDDGITQEYYKVGEFSVIGKGEPKVVEDKDDDSDTLGEE